MCHIFMCPWTKTKKGSWVNTPSWSFALRLSEALAPGSWFDDLHEKVMQPWCTKCCQKCGVNYVKKKKDMYTYMP